MPWADTYTLDPELRSTYYVADKQSAERISDYLENEHLLEPEKHADLFKISQKDVKKSYIPFDLPGMLARLVRHYTFGPSFAVCAENGGKKADANVRRIMRNNGMVSMLRELAETLPVLGDAVVRVGLVEPEVLGSSEKKRQARIMYVKPHYVFPEVNLINRDLVEELRVVKLYSAQDVGLGESQNQVALIETHTVGSFEFTAQWWDGEKLLDGDLDLKALFPELEAGPQPTGIDEIPFVFVPNNRRAGDFWGRSEFPRIKSVVQALEKRMAQLDEVLEKHAKPKLIVGPGVLDERGRVALEQFDVIEVEASVMEKAVKPEYLTWDMQIEAIKHQIEKLEEYFFMITETSPASFGLERDGSQVESARALRFKAHRTINKVEDLRDPLTDAVKKMLRLAQKLEVADGHGYKVAEVQVLWPDPIIEDNTQEAQDYSMMRQNGLVSIKRAIQDLHDLTDEEAEMERARILEDTVDMAEAEGAATAALGFGPVTEEGAVAPLPQGEAAPGAEVGSSALAAEPEKTADKEVVLNGAQVTALVNLVGQVAAGVMQRASAVRIIVAAFGLDEALAESILADAGTDAFTPKPGQKIPEPPAPAGE